RRPTTLSTVVPAQALGHAHIAEFRRAQTAGVTKARAATFPPPLWGRDREGGSDKHRTRGHPSPQPSPTRGEGAHRVRRSSNAPPRESFERASKQMCACLSAQAGTHNPRRFWKFTAESNVQSVWVPACAGTTIERGRRSIRRLPTHRLLHLRN